MTIVKPFRADKPRIYIVDVSNRDGVQARRVYLSDFEKTTINGYLARMGIRQSEFAFPANELDGPYILANLQLLEAGYLSPLLLSGWLRAIPEDVEKAAKYAGEGLKHLNLSASTSEKMIGEKFQGRTDGNGVINNMAKAVRRAKEAGFETVGVNAEDASRTDMGFLKEYALAAKEAGADRIRYCDTLGCERPPTIYQRIGRLAETVKIPIEPHCHNDLGLAVANSVEGAMAALDAGVDAYVNATVNGYGERAGNADLVSVLLALKFSRDMKDKDVLDPRVNLGMAWTICNYASLANRRPIPPDQPGVGSNAFSHESGIHVDLMLKGEGNGYELYGPEVLGIPAKVEIRTGRELGVGDYSGLAALKNKFGELGIETRDIDKALALVRSATHLCKRELTEDELRLIAGYPEQLERMLLGIEAVRV